MPNIKLSYFYRDSGNYKKYDYVVFSNPVGIELAKLENLIRSELIFQEYFYAAEWGLPEFFTEYVDFRFDPTWHEFETLEYTDEPVDSSVDLGDFIKTLNPA